MLFSPFLSGRLSGVFYYCHSQVKFTYTTPSSVLNSPMKVCPQCTSTRVRFSHVRTLFESFLRTGMGFRFYRCQECNWRGMERPVKKINKYSGKKASGSSWEFTPWLYSWCYILSLLLLESAAYLPLRLNNAHPRF
jgi:hypothetical protein